MLCRFFASWTSRPHSAVVLRPRHLAAFALPAALRPPFLCHSCCRPRAPWRYDAAPAAAPVHGADLALSTVLRLHLCPPIALWRWMLLPLLSHLGHLRSAAMDSPKNPESDRFPQRHRLEAVPENPETKNRPVLQLFCDYGLPWVPLIANQGVKAQVICCKAAIVRFPETEKSPQSQKSCKIVRIFVFAMGGSP